MNVRGNDDATIRHAKEPIIVNINARCSPTVSSTLAAPARAFHAPSTSVPARRCVALRAGKLRSPQLHSAHRFQEGLAAACRLCQSESRVSLTRYQLPAAFGQALLQGLVALPFEDALQPAGLPFASYLLKQREALQAEERLQ